MTVAAPANKQPGDSSDRRVFGPDPLLLAVVLVILAAGIVMVTSASFIIASGKFGDGFYYTKKQGLAMAIGLATMYLFSLIDPSFWKRVGSLLLAAGLVLLILVFVPGLGVETGGSSRWIRLPLGFYLQPSEIVKYALIIFLAKSLAKKGDSIREFAIGFVPHVLIMGVVVLLILYQPDFGTAVIITVVGFLMLFVAGVRLQHLFGSILLCLPFVFYLAVNVPYRKLRMMSFLDPWGDPLNSGFQIIQSLVAFGCGGFWGVGIGKGIQKLFYLPQPHSDFIFAVAGEELGLLGVSLLIILFYVLICRGLVVAIRSSDKFYKFLAFGITCLIGLQAMVNMAVAMGILPTKGLPLPFVSVGGTSLIMNLAGLGILMALTRASQAASREVDP